MVWVLLGLGLQQDLARRVALLNSQQYLYININDQVAVQNLFAHIE
jgi:hypothetical protein